VKLKLIFVGLTIGLVQITPSDAQSILPAGHYTYNRRGQLGEMRVQKVGVAYLCHCGRGTEGPGYGRRLWAARRRSNRRQDVPRRDQIHFR